ncbi:hypothetical protein [Microbacterium sp. p3-SID336]|uniref:hypothetical protein n=1 Tax=Microbacterium sp. p3-SID336 TaxID=2916212 RepID=UPI0021A84609|nr:hypothetical protein [Microbacterium sp. p3-SID336]MCT1478424.1 hypothetical protein [Microbacterium sp. p3-SID336]
MSDLTIDHGGVVAVDTAQLRAVAVRISGAAASCERVAGFVEEARVVVASEPAAFAGVPLPALRAAAQALHELGVELDDAATGAQRMADVFEVVELRARVEALAQTDAAAAAAAQVALDRLIAAHPEAGIAATLLARGWEETELLGARTPTSLRDVLGIVALPATARLAHGIGSATGLATVRPGGALRGRADAVRVRPVASSTPSAPADLVGALRRLPERKGAQVAVERYTMVDGTSRYVAYLSGTRSASVDAAGAEPWDNRSNVQLYTGQRSASYQATLDALAASGAKAGDRVDVVAHSQSGMIAAHLAMESDFEVPMQVTLGSPVGQTLDDDQTLVQLANWDDAVSELAAGGSAAGTGSADSFTARRTVDPLPGLQDLGLGAHGRDAYLETARMVDDSVDPRAEALDGYWAELGEAVAVERIEYRAERVSP